MLENNQKEIITPSNIHQHHSNPIRSSLSADQLIPLLGEANPNKKKHQRLFSKLGMANFPPINLDTGNKIVAIKGELSQLKNTENNYYSGQNHSDKKIPVLDRENLMRNFPISYFQNVDLLFKIISKKKKFIKNTYQSEKKGERKEKQNSLQIPHYDKQLAGQKSLRRPQEGRKVRQQNNVRRQYNERRDENLSSEKRLSYRNKQSSQSQTKNKEKKLLQKVLSQQKLNKKEEKQGSVGRRTLYNGLKSEQKFRIKQVDKTNNINTSSQDQFIKKITSENAGVSNIKDNMVPLQKKGMRFKKEQTMKDVKPRQKDDKQTPPKSQDLTMKEQEKNANQRKSQQLQRREFKKKTLNSEHFHNASPSTRKIVRQPAKKEAFKNNKQQKQYIYADKEQEEYNNQTPLSVGVNQLTNKEKFNNKKIDSHQFKKNIQNKIVEKQQQNNQNTILKDSLIPLNINFDQSLKNVIPTFRNLSSKSKLQSGGNLASAVKENKHHSQSQSLQQQSIYNPKEEELLQQLQQQEKEVESPQKILTNNSQVGSSQEDLTKTPHFHFKKQPIIKIIAANPKSSKQVSFQIPHAGNNRHKINSNLLQTFNPCQQQPNILQKNKDAEPTKNTGKTSKEHSIIDSEEINKFYNELIELQADQHEEYRPKMGRLSNISENCHQQFRKQERDSKNQSQIVPTEYKIGSLHSIDKAVMVYTESDNIISSSGRVYAIPGLNKKASSKISIFSSSSSIQRVQPKKKHNTIFEQEEQNFLYQTKPLNVNLNQSLVMIDINGSNPIHHQKVQSQVIGPASRSKASQDFLKQESNVPSNNEQSVLIENQQSQPISHIAINQDKSNALKIPSQSNVSLLSLNQEQEALINKDLQALNHLHSLEKQQAFHQHSSINMQKKIEIAQQQPKAPLVIQEDHKFEHISDEQNKTDNNSQQSINGIYPSKKEGLSIQRQIKYQVKQVDNQMIKRQKIDFKQQQQSCPLQDVDHEQTIIKTQVRENQHRINSQIISFISQQQPYCEQQNIFEQSKQKHHALPSIIQLNEDQKSNKVIKQDTMVASQGPQATTQHFTQQKPLDVNDENLKQQQIRLIHPIISEKSLEKQYQQQRLYLQSNQQQIQGKYVQNNQIQQIKEQNQKILNQSIQQESEQQQKQCQYKGKNEIIVDNIINKLQDKTILVENTKEKPSQITIHKIYDINIINSYHQPSNTQHQYSIIKPQGELIANKPRQMPDQANKPAKVKVGAVQNLKNEKQSQKIFSEIQPNNDINSNQSLAKPQNQQYFVRESKPSAGKIKQNQQKYSQHQQKVIKDNTIAYDKNKFNDGLKNAKVQQSNEQVSQENQQNIFIPLQGCIQSKPSSELRESHKDQSSQVEATKQRVRQVNCSIQQEYMFSNQSSKNLPSSKSDISSNKLLKVQELSELDETPKKRSVRMVLVPIDRAYSLEKKDIETNTLDLLNNLEQNQLQHQINQEIALITNQIINFKEPTLKYQSQYKNYDLDQELWDMVVSIFTFLRHDHLFIDRLVDYQSIWLFSSHQNLSRLMRYALSGAQKSNKLNQLKEGLRRYLWSKSNMSMGKMTVKLILQTLTGMPVLLLKETCYHKLDNLYRHNNIFGFTFGQGEVWRIVGTMSSKKNIQEKRVRLQKLSNKEIIQISWKKFLQHFKHSFITAFSPYFYMTSISMSQPKTNGSFKLTVKGSQSKKIHFVMGITSDKGKQFNGKMLVYGEADRGKKGEICYKYLGSGDVGLVSMKLKEGQYIIVVQLQQKQVEDYEILVGSESKDIVLKLQQV